MNWATQIAARVAKSASSVTRSEVPPVLQPPHAKPVTIAMAAPRIRPQTPYLTPPARSGSIDGASVKCDDIITSQNSIRKLEESIPATGPHTVVEGARTRVVIGLLETKGCYSGHV